MARSLARLVVALSVLAVPGCTTPAAPPPHAAQTTGTMRVPGLTAPVTVLRDQWGVPHISAATIDDLFFTQGFVQAQDRLFQMDLWKRSAQGRLSEVMGANFIQRDTMTRRIQFRGDLDREWASYGPDAHRIAVAFTNGINAWVRIARLDPPEEFALAGWAPELWKPEDLLNRTDAFLASVGAQDELFRARLVVALGAHRANELFPLPERQTLTLDPAVDLTAVTFVVSDALRRVGTPPFFLTLANKASEAPRPGQVDRAGAPPRGAPPSPGDVGASGLAEEASAPAPRSQSPRPLAVKARTWLVDGASSATGAPLVGVSLTSPLAAPAARYIVHLSAPGLNVIGATAPWLPGVAIGHNDHVAWAMRPLPVDTQDIFIERLNPKDPHQVERDGRFVDMQVDYDRLDVKGRDRPVQYERQYTSNGVVIAQDRERNLVYTLKWSGTEPGGAGELAALAFIRSTSTQDFARALAAWKAPVAEFIAADTQGHTLRVSEGLVPVRQGRAAFLPSAGWSSARAWTTFSRPASSAEGATAVGPSSLAELNRVQLDTSSPAARTLLAFVDQVRSYPRELERVRADLLAWDGRFDGRGGASALYERLERAIEQILVSTAGIPNELSQEAADQLDVVSLFVRPSRAWFGGNPQQERARILLDALSKITGSADGPPDTPAGAATFEFAHPLAVFEPARRRFNVGPLPRRGGRDTFNASSGSAGTVFRAIFDVKDWNRSVAINAPGQSGSPASAHYDDLAARWATGEPIDLAFDQPGRTDSRTEALTLQPATGSSAR